MATAEPSLNSHGQSADPIRNITSESETPFPQDWSLEDLRQHLDGVSLSRIRLTPALGYAKVEDVIREEKAGRLVELEDGVSLEKTRGWYESIVGVQLAYYLMKYLETNDLGQVLGADGCLQILPGIVKTPDVSFISWGRFPEQPLPRTPVPSLVPDLAVEVLSESNTADEMEFKLNRYFEAGVLLVWYIEPTTRSARAYTGPSEVLRIAADGQLDGGEVLPGFSLKLADLFERADRQFHRGKKSQG